MISRYFFSGFALSCIGIALAWYFLINHDAAVYLNFAGLILEGKHFYTDLFDTNTPLIIYLTTIPVALSKFTGIASINWFFILIFLLLHYCIFLSWKVLRNHILFRDSPRDLGALITGLYVAIFILPNSTFDFGQREHLLCALILPYLAATWVLQGNQLIVKRHRIIAGALAGIGFALKPHFVVIFLFAELGHVVQQRRLFAWLRLETIIIGGVLLSYYATMVLFTPEYFGLIPFLITYYKAYHSPVSVTVESTLGHISLAFVLLLFAKRAPYRNIVIQLFFLALGGTTIYVLQFCSFSYHAIPILFFEILMAAFISFIYLDRRFYYGFLLLFLIIIFSASFVEQRLKYKDVALSIAQTIEKHAGEEAVTFLSSNVSPASPIVNYSGAKWGLNIACLFHLPAAYLEYRGSGKEPPYHSPEQMGAAEKELHERLIKSLQQKPKLIIVDSRKIKQGFLGMEFDFIHYLQNDARFLEIWTHYRPLQRIDEFDLYIRE